MYKQNIKIRDKSAFTLSASLLSTFLRRTTSSIKRPSSSESRTTTETLLWMFLKPAITLSISMGFGAMKKSAANDVKWLHLHSIKDEFV